MDCCLCGQQQSKSRSGYSARSKLSAQSSSAKSYSNIIKIIQNEFFDFDPLSDASKWAELCITCDKLCSIIHNVNGGLLVDIIWELLSRQANGSSFQKVTDHPKIYSCDDIDYEALQNFTYKCKICPYATDRFVNLSPHYLVHKFEKPVLCNETENPEILLVEDVEEEVSTLKVELDSDSCGSSKRKKTKVKKKKDIRSASARSTKRVQRERKSNKFGKEKVTEIACYCNVCGFEYTGENCTHPLIIQYDLKPLQCLKCDEVVYMKHLVKRHQRFEHNICVCCSEEFSSRLSLVKHEKEHKRRRDKIEFPCTWCEKTYQTILGARNHMVSHTGLYKYSCEICDKRYSSKLACEEHMTLHTKKALYVCNLCGKSLFSATTFRMHSMWHTDRLPFKCEKCPKMFRSQSYLAKHRRISHLNQPLEYKCKHCGQIFKTVTQQKIHQVEHTGKHPFWCTICEKGFIRRSKYATHLWKVHKDESMIKNKKVCEYKMAVPYDDNETPEHSDRKTINQVK